MAKKPETPQDQPGKPARRSRLFRPIGWMVAFVRWLVRQAGVYWRTIRNPELTVKRRLWYASSRMSLNLVVLGIIYAGLLYIITPGTSSLMAKKRQLPSRVLATNGEVLHTFKRTNVEWVTLDQVSPHLVDALVATEDHRFYDHFGVDLRRFASSTIYTLLGDRQGGSTITMQLARNLFPRRIGNATSLQRKFKEMVTAIKIERLYSKEEVLEAYLNTVPYLYNVRGIELASKTYFNKAAENLSVAEAATLVGMLKATSFYNPVRNPDRSRERRDVVLAQMVKRAKLDSTEFESLRSKPIVTRFNRQRFNTGRAAHFITFVEQEIEDWARREGHDLYADGLTIYSTLNADLQRLAEEAVSRQMTSLQAVADVEWSRKSNRVLSQSPRDYVKVARSRDAFGYLWSSKKEMVNQFIRESSTYAKLVASGATPEEAVAQCRKDATFMKNLKKEKTRLETGFVAVRPGTGEIKAWVGSRSNSGADFDHVSTARRQPGSTFKPFVYAAALEDGMSPMDEFWDRPVFIKTRRGEVWAPTNVAAYSGERVTMRTGLAQSNNAVTVQLMESVGPRRVAKLARKMGIRQSEMDHVPSLALGTSSVTLLEMVSSYSSVASSGHYAKPRSVRKIEDADGQLLVMWESPTERVLSETTSAELTDMMRDVIDEGTGRRIRSVFGVRCDVAGKTGTTQNNADGWFLMMHGDLVAGSWVGFNDPRITFRSDYWGQGSHNALYVVGDFYRHSLRQGQLSPKVTLAEPAPGSMSPGRMAKFASWLDEAAKSVGEGWDWVRTKVEEENERIRDSRGRSPLVEHRPAERVSIDGTIDIPERVRHALQSFDGVKELLENASSEDIRAFLHEIESSGNVSIDLDHLSQREISLLKERVKRDLSKSLRDLLK